MRHAQSAIGARIELVKRAWHANYQRIASSRTCVDWNECGNGLDYMLTGHTLHGCVD